MNDPAQSVQSISESLLETSEPRPLITSELPASITRELPSNTAEALNYYSRQIGLLNEAPLDQNKLMVVIAAHNEGPVIGETLEHLFDNGLDGLPQKIETVISLDGCTDDTLGKIRAFAVERNIPINVITLNHPNDQVSIPSSGNENREITVINKIFNKGKTDALMQVERVLAGRDSIPAHILALDADTHPEKDYAKKLLEEIKDKPNYAAISGKVQFKDNGQGLETFADTINGIHGNPELGGNWIPGAAALWDTRAFVAGYRTVSKYFPYTKIEDVTAGLMSNLAGLRTKVLVDLPFETLAAEGEASSDKQMSRWLDGATQIGAIFGSTLKDFGMETKLENIVLHQIKTKVAAANNIGEVIGVIKEMTKRIPFVFKYLKTKNESNKNKEELKTSTAFKWAPQR